MVKNTPPRKVARDLRRPGPRSRGPRVTSSRQVEDDMGHMNQKDRGQESHCREPPNISQTPAASHSHHLQTWATISLDRRGHVHIETSPDFKQYEKELFAPELQQKFLPFAKVQDPIVLAFVGREFPNQHLDPENAYGEPFDRRASNRAQLCRKRRRSSARRTITSIALDLDPDLKGQADEELAEAQEMNFKHESIFIGDVQAVETYYLERFLWIQQLACKLIALDWIKRIEPRKMSIYPYNGHPRQLAGQKQAEVEGSGEIDREVTKAPWWPLQDCPYETPTHQGRNARLLLLLHLLRHVHEFKKEITSVELKAVSDKIPLEPKQRMWLDEIYSLRKQEERFERKEIDGDTLVRVRVAVPKSRKKSKPSRKKKTIPSSRARARARTSPDGSVTSQNTCSSPQQECSDSGSPAGNTEPHKPDNFGSTCDNTESQEQPQDRFSDAHMIDAQAISAYDRCGGGLTGPLQEVSRYQYVPGSTAHNGGQQIRVEAQANFQDVYMEPEPAIEAHILEFGRRGPDSAFAMLEAEQMDDRTLNQSPCPLQPHSTGFNGYYSPSVPQHHSSQYQSIYPSPQNLIQVSSQLPLGINSITHLTGYQSQQPCHTPSQNLAAPGNVSYHVRAYGSDSSYREPDFDQCHDRLPNADSYDYPMDPNHLHPR